MGWIISLFLIVLGLVAKEYMILLASGLFAISGAIEMIGTAIRKKEGEN